MEKKTYFYHHHHLPLLKHKIFLRLHLTSEAVYFPFIYTYQYNIFEVRTTENKMQKIFHM